MVTGVDDEAADRAYRWTIRALYVTAIALNLWLLWDQVKDTPEAGEFRARIQGAKDRVLAPSRARKELRLEEAKTVFEAWQILEEADRA